MWELALDELHDTGTAVRARMQLDGEMVGARTLAGAGSKPLSEIVTPLVLDRLTVADDADFVPGLGTQKNLPDWLKSELASLLG